MADPRFVPVTRHRAYESVVHQVEEALLRGDLRSGDRLPSERELCLQMGVSRPTVREALRALEIAGMVEMRPNDPTGGAVVRLPDSAGFERSLVSLVRFSQVSLADLVGFRMLIETTACHLAARSDDAAAIEQIATAHAAAERLAGGDDDDEFVAADIAFHVAIAKASGNRMLELCTDAVRSAMESLIGDAISRTEGAARRDFVTRHGMILKAIRDRDPQEAAQRARRDIVDYYVPLLDRGQADHVDALQALLAP